MKLTESGGHYTVDPLGHEDSRTLPLANEDTWEWEPYTTHMPIDVDMTFREILADEARYAFADGALSAATGALITVEAGVVCIQCVCDHISLSAPIRVGPWAIRNEPKDRDDEIASEVVTAELHLTARNGEKLVVDIPVFGTGNPAPKRFRT